MNIFWSLHFGLHSCKSSVLSMSIVSSIMWQTWNSMVLLPHGPHNPIKENLHLIRVNPISAIVSTVINGSPGKGYIHTYTHVYVYVYAYAYICILFFWAFPETSMLRRCTAISPFCIITSLLFSPLQVGNALPFFNLFSFIFCL